MAPLSRWHRLFADALANHEAIGVAVTVQQHLGRQPTRSELSACRRAAHSYAEAGRAHITQVSVSAPTAGGRGGVYLILVRPESSRSGGHYRAMLREAAQGWTPSPSETGRVRRWQFRQAPFLRRTVSTVEEAAAGVRYLDAAAVEPAEAQELSESLGDALLELSRLRRLLVRRGQPIGTLDATNGEAAELATADEATTIAGATDDTDWVEGDG